MEAFGVFGDGFNVYKAIELGRRLYFPMQWSAGVRTGFDRHQVQLLGATILVKKSWTAVQTAMV